MAPSQEQWSICRYRYCKRRFEQKAGPGRKKDYCTTSCRRREQRIRDGRPPAVKDTCPPQAQRIAEHLQGLIEQLLLAEYSGQELPVLLHQAAEVAREVEYYTAAAVLDARNRGTSWKTVARAALVSTTTARTRWAEKEVHRQLENRGKSRRPAETSGIPSASQPASRSALKNNSNPAVVAQESCGLRSQLSAALGYLQRASGRSISEVADEMAVSSSHISRILSGERMTSWPVMRELVRKFKGNPEELRLLWEQAQGVALHVDREVEYSASGFHAALRGLYLAAGCPDYAALQEAGGDALDAQMIDALLGGDLVPRWETVGVFVTLLRGHPAAIRPLWEAVYYGLFEKGQSFSPPPGPHFDEGPVTEG